MQKHLYKYISCVDSHKEPNSTSHHHFSFFRYILLFYLYRPGFYTCHVDLYIYRRFLAHCSHIQAFLHLLLTQKVLLHSQTRWLLLLHNHHFFCRINYLFFDQVKSWYVASWSKFFIITILWDSLLIKIYNFFKIFAFHGF